MKFYIYVAFAALFATLMVSIYSTGSINGVSSLCRQMGYAGGAIAKGDKWACRAQMELVPDAKWQPGPTWLDRGEQK